MLPNDSGTLISESGTLISFIPIVRHFGGSSNCRATGNSEIVNCKSSDGRMQFYSQKYIDSTLEYSRGEQFNSMTEEEVDLLPAFCERREDFIADETGNCIDYFKSLNLEQ